jgi:hypothetical protein
MALKKFFFLYNTFSINDGPHIRFGEDNWLDNVLLCEQYSTLYNIVLRKSDTIATVMATSPLDVMFRRDLIGLRLVAWNSDDIQLSPGPDEFGEIYMPMAPSRYTPFTKRSFNLIY